MALILLLLKKYVIDVEDVFFDDKHGNFILFYK